MEIFPGSSPLSSNEIVPVTIKGVSSDPNKRDVSLEIKGIQYKNTYDNTLKDTNFATVIYNKKLKRLSVIHSRAEFLIPVFSSTSFNQESSSLTSITNNANEAFGSSKLLKSIKEKEKYALSQEVTKDLKDISRQFKSEKRLERSCQSMSERVGSDGLVDISVVLPQFNAETNDPHEIYALDNLITKKLLPFLIEDSSAIFKYEKKAVIKCFKSIYKRASKFELKTDNFQESNTEKALLTYLRLLLVIYLSHPSRFNHKKPFYEENQQQMKILLDLFTTYIKNGKLKTRILSPVMKQKCLNYIYISFLHIDKFRLKIDGDLCEDLRLSSEQIRKNLMFVGCKVKKDDDGNYIAHLNAPLYLPSLNEQTNKK